MPLFTEFGADWPDINALLDEALSLPAHEHDRWLDTLAGERAQHRESLRRLLARRAAVESDDFLGAGPSLAQTVLSPATPGLAPDVELGGYRLIRELGRGGMSSVWLAERGDGSLRRRVALKLPRAVWGDTFADRLVRERDILAGLEHEHIARLYDAGVDEHGRPFIAMEFIDGEPIDVHCAKRALSVRERVGLLRQVMSAVAHAHAHLVVHRDLKPANILVTPDGRVHLLDFGIAKLLQDDLAGHTHLTELSGRALTPDYASPEQIRGEPLGTGSDIYSMAVVAFEVLTGHRPYRLKRGTAAELEEAIAAAEPPLASAVVPDKAPKQQLRGDLDAILAKALKKRPEQRYATMDAFAQDLARWLAGEPVQARPDSLAYRAHRFVGRRRLEVAAAAVIALTVVAGASAALWQAARARTEARTAKAVQGFIEGVFRANSSDQDDPERARAATARQLLDRGAERVERELADAPEARLRMYAVMAEMFSQMALNDKAIEFQRRRVALATQVHGADDEATMEASADLAQPLIEAGRLEEARALLQRADAAASRHAPSNPELRMLIDTALAVAYNHTEPVRSQAWARQAASLARGLPPSKGTVAALQIFGNSAFGTEHFDEALEALQEVQAQIAKRPETGTGILPLILAEIGQVHDILGDSRSAGAALVQADELARRGGDLIGRHLVAYHLTEHQLLVGSVQEALATSSPSYEWARGAGADFGSFPQVIQREHAHVLCAAGEPARALQVLDEMRLTVARLQPNEQKQFHAFRIEALVLLGRAADAGSDAEELSRLLHSQPHGVSELSHQVLRRYWGALGQPARALDDLLAETRQLSTEPRGLARLRRRAEEAHWLVAAGRVAEGRALAAATLQDIQQSPQRDLARPAQAEATEALGRARPAGAQDGIRP